MCLEALGRCGCSVSEKKRVFRDDLGTVSELLRNSSYFRQCGFWNFDVSSFRIEVASKFTTFNIVCYMNNKILKYYVRMIPELAL